MNLGIAGRKAMVCGASKGLGFAAAAALAREGVTVFIAARTPEPLYRAASEILREAPGKAHPVVADVTQEEGRQALLAACPDPDILITNAAGPPPGKFGDWTLDHWNAAIGANMLSPIMLMRGVLDGMIARRFGRIINITSGKVKMPEGFLGLSNGARAGLTGVVGGLAREVVKHNVTVNNVLPGPFDTERLYAIHQHLADQRGKPIAEVRGRAAAAIPAGRFGDPAEFGAVCAFLASSHSGFISGQNIVIDGGEYPGLL